MSKMKLQILTSAENDIAVIVDYIARDKKTAAQKLLKDFYKSFDRLAHYPYMGSKKSDFTYQDVRFWVVKKNYLVIYKIVEDVIYILRVLPAYQDICALL